MIQDHHQVDEARKENAADLDFLLEKPVERSGGVSGSDRQWSSDPMIRANSSVSDE
jgi:hypothetical protein